MPGWQASQHFQQDLIRVPSALPPPKPEVSPWQESGLHSGIGGGEEEANRKLPGL